MMKLAIFLPLIMICHAAYSEKKMKKGTFKKLQKRHHKIKKAIKKFKGYKTSFNIGLGMGHQTDLYKAGNTNFPLIPIVGFKYKNFFGYGINYGYTFYWNWPTLSLSIKPELIQLKSKKGTITQGLLERKVTLNTGIKAIFPTKAFIGTIDLYHDTFKRYDGLQAELAFNKPIKISKKISSIIGLSFSWLSRQYNNYYFGVSPHEANLSLNRPSYQPQDSITSNLQLVGIYQFSPKVSFVLINHFTYLPSEIHNSPLIAKNYINRFYITFTYSF